MSSGRVSAEGRKMQKKDFKTSIWTTSLGTLLVKKTSPPLGWNYRVAIKISFRKNSQNRLGFLFSGEKSVPFAEFCVLAVRIANAKVRNRREWKGTERNSATTCFFEVIRMFFYVLEWFGTSFQKFFLSLNGSERNSEFFM